MKIVKAMNIAHHAELSVLSNCHCRFCMQCMWGVFPSAVACPLLGSTLHTITLERCLLPGNIDQA